MYNGNVVLDAQDIRFLENRIKEYGSMDLLMERIFKELDATYVMPNGMRPRQTNSYVWKHTDAEFHYLLNKMCDNGLDNNTYNSYMTTYNAICKCNADFEKENPPIDYGNKTKTKTKRTSKIAKTVDMFTGEVKKVSTKTGKEIKESATEIRRKRVIAGASFSFGIKKE